MKIESQPRDDHQVKLTVELEADAFEQYTRKAARKISQEARIPGFRPGKVPFDMIKRIYGEKALHAQAVDLWLDEMYPKILDEAKLDPGGPGNIDAISETIPPSISLIVPLAPTVDLGDYKAVRQDYHIEPVTDEDVDRVLRRLRISNATATEVERPAEAGDQVEIKLSAHLTKPAEGQTAEVIHEQPLNLIVEQEDIEEEPWPYQGFTKELVGVTAKSEKTVLYTYPETYNSERLKGQEVEFSVKVETVKSLDLPELNDEFAPTIGNFQTLQALRDAIRGTIEGNRKQGYEQEYYEKLITSLVDQSTVKFPPNMLEEEIKSSLEALERDVANAKMDLETYLKSIKETRETFVEKQVRPAAKRRIERSLVLRELTIKEEITVEPNELQAAVARNIQSFSEEQLNSMPRGMTPKVFAESVTYETANRLLSQRLMERLKAIATGVADQPAPEVVTGETEPPVLTETTSLPE